MGETPNIWSDEWEFESDEEWAAGKSTRLPRGNEIGATVAEIAPNETSGFYHFHHGSEELLIVLTGRPTVRTPEGERQLAEGEVVHFPVGPDGAHGLRNDSDDVVRYLVAGIRVSPEVAEYPDLNKVTAQARTNSQNGEPLFVIHDLDQSGA